MNENVQKTTNIVQKFFLVFYVKFTFDDLGIKNDKN
jgi:hypothetical protein